LQRGPTAGKDGTTVGAVAGVWSVLLALAAANLTVVAINYKRLPSLRGSLDAGATSVALPILMISSLVGFGAVVAALPAFAQVREAVLSVQGGPLISLTVSMNALAALTGTASGGMAIALNALGENYMRLAAEYGIDPRLCTA
jgi:H+/gluconate symporter-like permease